MPVITTRLDDDFRARVPPDLRDQIAAIAAEQDRSMAAVIRVALREYIARHAETVAA